MIYSLSPNLPYDPKCSEWNIFYIWLCAAFLCSSIRKSKKFLFPSLCSCESWKQSPHSAQQNKLSHSVVFRPVQALAQMTESLSRGTATSAGEYLHVSQPVCFFLRLNLSSFHCLLSLFSRSLFHSSQRSLSVTHCLVENKGSAVRDKKGHLSENKVKS